MPPADSFPRQHARTRRFTLGAPRTITVSPDGERVVFCRSLAGDDPINRLWVLDVATGRERLVADPLTEPDGADLPPEERARRERVREAGDGIVGYATDDAVTVATYVSGGAIHRADLVSGGSLTVPSEPGAFDPRPAPGGNRIAYVAAGGLHVIDGERGDIAVAADDDPDVSWGVAEFVAAEEMGRGRGYWWSPSGDVLLAARVDQRDVLTWHIASPATPAAEPAMIRYPAAGTANAVVDLALVGLDGETIAVDWRRDEFEYLAGVRWSPDPEPTLVVQTRDQRTLAVLRVDPVTGATAEAYRLEDPHWVELVPGAPRWVDGKLLTVEDRGLARRLVLDGVALTADDVQVSEVVAADPDHGIVVVATTEPTEAHVAAVDLDGSLDWLTTEPGVHRAAAGGDVVVVSSWDLTRPRSTHRVIRGGAEVARLDSHAEEPVRIPSVELLRAGRDELRTAVLWPGETTDGPLPILLDPYGGPHARRAMASQHAHGVSQWFADQGYCVIVCDGRGTPARGPLWERSVRGDLAGPVLEDQLRALDHVAGSHADAVDTGRVAIRGWSFGGYLAALAVLRRPDVFHAAIAGAPVTDWRLYDTHYTERYLGHPDDEPENYARTDLIPHAPDLRRPLLLIHGLADDNVVVAHTLQLSQALLEAGRPHQVLPLSSVTHMTPQEVVAENLLLVQLAFFRQALTAPEAP